MGGNVSYDCLPLCRFCALPTRSAPNIHYAVRLIYHYLSAPLTLTLESHFYYLVNLSTNMHERVIVCSLFCHLLLTPFSEGRMMDSHLLREVVTQRHVSYNVLTF